MKYINTVKDPATAIFLFAFLLSGMVVTSAALIGANVTASGAIALAFLVLGFVLGRVQARDIGAATALIGQAIAFTAAFPRHSWQVDTHMLFFALLASLIVLRSIPLFWWRRS